MNYAGLYVEFPLTLTPFFLARQYDPSRAGIYSVTLRTVGGFPCFAHWNGKRWMGASSTISGAVAYAQHGLKESKGAIFQWRGIVRH